MTRPRRPRARRDRALYHASLPQIDAVYYALAAPSWMSGNARHRLEREIAEKRDELGVRTAVAAHLAVISWWRALHQGGGRGYRGVVAPLRRQAEAVTATTGRQVGVSTLRNVVRVLEALHLVVRDTHGEGVAYRYAWCPGCGWGDKPFDDSAELAVACPRCSTPTRLDRARAEVACLTWTDELRDLFTTATPRRHPTPPNFGAKPSHGVVSSADTLDARRSDIVARRSHLEREEDATTRPPSEHRSAPSSIDASCGPPGPRPSPPAAGSEAARATGQTGPHGPEKSLEGRPRRARPERRISGRPHRTEPATQERARRALLYDLEGFLRFRKHDAAADSLLERAIFQTRPGEIGHAAFPWSDYLRHWRDMTRTARDLCLRQGVVPALRAEHRRAQLWSMPGTEGFRAGRIRSFGLELEPGPRRQIDRRHVDAAAAPALEASGTSRASPSSIGETLWSLTGGDARRWAYHASAMPWSGDEIDRVLEHVSAGDANRRAELEAALKRRRKHG